MTTGESMCVKDKGLHWTRVGEKKRPKRHFDMSSVKISKDPIH